MEPSPLDTAGAIRFAADFDGIDDTFIVLNGDVLTDFDISGLVAFHRERGAEGTIGLTPVDDPSSFGVVPTDEDGKVKRKKIYDTTITQAKEICTTLKEFNLTNNQELETARQRLVRGRARGTSQHRR